ncbi:MAG: hypothetical protein ABSB39_22755 [Candidatus Sulfotelmatobacter sp.]
MSTPTHDAIKPQASMTIYWTIALINTFAVAASTIAFHEKKAA